MPCAGRIRASITPGASIRASIAQGGSIGASIDKARDALYEGAYGVYPYSITTGGTLTIRRRYNSTNTLTINDDFNIRVYKLTVPSGFIVFD